MKEQIGVTILCQAQKAQYNHLEKLTEKIFQQIYKEFEIDILIG